MKKGFLLVEAVVASVIILAVLSALAFALTAFVKGSRSIELQQGALTLARVEMARMENLQTAPEPGRTVRADSLWNADYTVDTTISPSGENSVDVLVAVASDENASVELSRRFYFE